MCRQCLCAAAFTLSHTWPSLSERRQVFCVHPCWPSAVLACLSVHWKGQLLCSEEAVKISQVCCTPLPLEAVSYGLLKSRYLKRLKIDFLKSRIIILLSILLTSLKLWSQNHYCRLCSKDIMIGNIHNDVSCCWELQMWKYYRECKLVY